MAKSLQLKTFCPMAHDLSGDNLKVWSSGRLVCGVCRALAAERRIARIKAEGGRKWKILSQQRVARSALGWAVRCGRIEKPSRCQFCGCKYLLVGHHKDYSKPLNVLWLCRRCHARIHDFKKVNGIR